MSDSIVARLRILLGIDSAEVTTGAKKAEKEVQKMSKGISGWAKLATGALGAMGAALTVDTIINVTKRAIEFTTAIKDQARVAGVSTSALQEYRYAALQAGLQNEELTDGFKDLTLKIGEAAAGGKSAIAIFKDAGISLRDANGEVRNAADIMPELADAYNKLSSEAEKSSFVARIFGEDNGPKMKALLEQGRIGMDGYRQAAQELGLVISDVNIKKAEEAEKKMKALNQILSVKIAGTVSDNADSIAYLVDQLISLTDAISNVLKFQRGFANIRTNEGLWTALTTPVSEIVSSADIGSYRQSYYGRNPLKFKDNVAPVTVDPRYLTGTGTRQPFSIGPRAPWPMNNKAVGTSAFGGEDMSRFLPGLGASGWIKAAEASGVLKDNGVTIAAAAARIDTHNAAASEALRQMAEDRGPKLIAVLAKTTPELERLRDATQNILDRLFPEQAELRQYQMDLATLTAAMRAGQLSTEDYAKAVNALRQEYNGFADELRAQQEILTTGIGPTLDDFLRQADDSWDAFSNKLVDGAKVSRVQVVQTFEQMAQDVLNSLSQLSNSIRGGGFFDILTSVLSVGLSLGKAGVFGSDFAASLNSAGGSGGIPGFATGGSMILGGRSGIDRNLLSLNGQALAWTSAGERMTISPRNDRALDGGGVVVVKVVEGALFRPVVESTAGRVVAVNAPAIAQAGANGGVARVRQMNSRRLA